MDLFWDVPSEARILNCVRFLRVWTRFTFRERPKRCTWTENIPARKTRNWNCTQIYLHSWLVGFPALDKPLGNPVYIAFGRVLPRKDYVFADWNRESTDTIPIPKLMNFESICSQQWTHRNCWNTLWLCAKWEKKHRVAWVFAVRGWYTLRRSRDVWKQL